MMFHETKLSPGIFSSLAKYCAMEQEHYTVEAFAFVLRLLLETDHEVALDILARFTSRVGFAFDNEDDIVVVAQYSTGSFGTPDITISCVNKLVLVEAKVESPVNVEQLDNYMQFLKSSGIRLHKLVLLTKHYPDLDEELRKQVREVRWDEVAHWLSEAKAKIRDPVSNYMVDSFDTFLKEGGISMEKVNGDYRMLKYSLPQLRNLLDIMDGVAKEVGSSIALGRVPWGWAGFYGSTKEWWFGLTFMHPLDLTLQITKSSAFDLSALEATLLKTLPSDLQKYQKERDGDILYFRWDLEKHAFFSLDLDDQVKMVRTLVQSSWDAVKGSKHRS